MSRRTRAFVTGMGCLFALSACGDSVDALSPDRVTDVQTQADWTMQRIGGSADQREAGNYLVHEAMNRPITDCMRKAGFDYESPVLRLWTGFEADGTSSGGWLGRLGDKPSARELAIAPARAYETDPPEETAEQSTAAYAKAMAGCEKSATPDAESLAEPAAVAAINADYTRLLDSVETQLADLSEYADCMSEHDIDLATVDAEGTAALDLNLESRSPTPPVGKSAPSPEWTTYLALETKAITADTDCRSSENAKGLAVLEPKLRAFNREHGAEITAAESAWEKLLDQAVAQGYKPLNPL